MAGFLYYAAGEAAPVRQDRAAELGLSHAIDRNPESPEVRGGPDGGHGYLFAVSDRLRLFDEDGGVERTLPVAYQPDHQTWVETPWPNVWVGYYNDHPPTPADLVRSETIAGYNFDLADGNKWLLPAVRQCVEGEPVSQLPSKLRMTPERKLVPAGPLDRAKWLWDATEKAWLSMITEKDLPEAEVNELVGQLFSANYFATDVELSAIGAFSQENFDNPVDLLAVSIGYFSWLEWKDAQETEKKSVSVTTGSGTSAG